jgi:hypothetical protein
MLAKSLSCNDAVLIGIPYYFRSLQIFRVYFYDMTSFSVTSIKKAIFRVPERFCAVFNSAKVGSLISIRTNQRHVWTPICVKKILRRSTCICPDDRATLSRHKLVFENNLNSFANTDWWRQLATLWTLGHYHLDAKDRSLIRKYVKCVIEVGCSFLSGHPMSRSGCHSENSESVLN